MCACVRGGYLSTNTGSRDHVRIKVVSGAAWVCPLPRTHMIFLSLSLSLYTFLSLSSLQPGAYAGGKGQCATAKPWPKSPTPTELEERALETCPPEQLLLTCIANLKDASCALAVLEALLDGCEKAVSAFERTRSSDVVLNLVFWGPRASS